MGGLSIGVNNQSFEIGMPKVPAVAPSPHPRSGIISSGGGRIDQRSKEGRASERPRACGPNDDEGRVSKRVIRWRIVNGGRIH